MICERISATAAKSRPKQGLAAISTLTSSASSRASTARWTLPPESVPIGASGPGVLTLVAARSARAAAPRMARAFSHQPPRAKGGWSKLRNARFSATLMRATQALRSGSSGSRQRRWRGSRRGWRDSARRRCGSAPRRLALAGQHLDQLALAVAGNPGDADDLARADRQVDSPRQAGRPRSSSAPSARRSQDAARRSCVRRDARRACGISRAPIIISAMSGRVRSGDPAAAGERPRRSTVTSSA